MKAAVEKTQAVVFEAPGDLSLRTVGLRAPGDQDVRVRVLYSGISTGTERLLWTGDMPPFPGLGYPLVPGYESVGEVIEAGAESGRSVGEVVFVPGASCYDEVHALFGGSAAELIVPGDRAFPVRAEWQDKSALLALAATAMHAFNRDPARVPELIVGHGILGRLLARIISALGHPAPVVWETNPVRAGGADGYAVVRPDADVRRDYQRIVDCSGDHRILDDLIAHLAPGGSVTLAGFYHEPVAFTFPPAFMREAGIDIAAEWKPGDLNAVLRLVSSGALSLDALVTHRASVRDAARAYDTAFNDGDCLKMILDWSDCQ